MTKRHDSRRTPSRGACRDEDERHRHKVAGDPKLKRRHIAIADRHLQLGQKAGTHCDSKSSDLPRTGKPVGLVGGSRLRGDS